MSWGCVFAPSSVPAAGTIGQGWELDHSPRLLPFSAGWILNQNLACQVCSGQSTSWVISPNTQHPATAREVSSHGGRSQGSSWPHQSPCLQLLSPQANFCTLKASFTTILHQNSATECGMCPVCPCPTWHTASTFFLCFHHCHDSQTFLLPCTPHPRHHTLKAIIIWLLMQFCDDRDHTQWDFDYSLLKMRRRLPFTSFPSCQQPHGLLALPLGWWTASTSPAQLLSLRGVVLPSTGVIPSVTINHIGILPLAWWL